MKLLLAVAFELHILGSLLIAGLDSAGRPLSPLRGAPFVGIPLAEETFVGKPWVGSL